MSKYNEFQFKQCKSCGKLSFKVLFGHLPVWLCEDRDCNNVTGFWSSLIEPYIFLNSLFQDQQGDQFVFFSYKQDESYLQCIKRRDGDE